MKLALLGYGKMGKEIKAIALNRGHNIVLEVSSDTKFTNADLKNADVAIEFSTPNSVLNNIDKCFDVNLPVVVGTTGWQNNLPDLKNTCKEREQTLFHSSNFSLGANIFFELNTRLAKMMNEHNSYNVMIEETHHTEKLDKPSGTAITLANNIIENNEKISKWSSSEVDTSDEVFISSKREKDVPGTHIITYESDMDSISIRHKANNRRGFATGAVIAAEWLLGRKGVFTMADLMKYK